MVYHQTALFNTYYYIPINTSLLEVILKVNGGGLQIQELVPGTHTIVNPLIEYVWVFFGGGEGERGVESCRMKVREKGKYKQIMT